MDGLVGSLNLRRPVIAAAATTRELNYCCVSCSFLDSFDAIVCLFSVVLSFAFSVTEDLRKVLSSAVMSWIRILLLFICKRIERKIKRERREVESTLHMPIGIIRMLGLDSSN